MITLTPSLLARCTLSLFSTSTTLYDSEGLACWSESWSESEPQVRCPLPTNRGSANRLNSGSRKRFVLVPVRIPHCYSPHIFGILIYFQVIWLSPSSACPSLRPSLVQFNLVPPTSPSKPQWPPSLILSQRYVPIHSIRLVRRAWAHPIASRSPTSRSMEASIPTNFSRLQAV